MSAKVNAQRLLYQGRVFRLIKENITLANGVTTEMDLIRHPGASAVVAMPSSESLLLVRQYRHALGRYIWEIPAGTLSPGETPLACARRELTEETGFAGRRFDKLGQITPLPGYCDERITIFLARELEPARQNLDQDEMMDVYTLPLRDVLHMVMKGQIQDSKTLSALLLTLNHLDAWSLVGTHYHIPAHK